MRISSLTFVRRALPLVAGAALVAAPAMAQETTPERENCICFDSPPEGAVFGSRLIQENRAQLGVYLGEAVDVDGRTGVEVMDVVEEGPAAEAGLAEGDIITALNGIALGDEPADALIEALSDVDPGDTVTLTYYRDGSQRTASVVTRKATGFSFFRSGDDFDVRVLPRVDRDRIRERIGELNVVTPRVIMRGLSPAGLELVELNPGLGEYFGTDQGVLVASIDDDADLGLRPGDVILAIDGRDVRDPAHVRAILDSYREDEAITFRIVRQERTIEVTGTLGS